MGLEAHLIFFVCTNGLLLLLSLGGGGVYSPLSLSQLYRYNSAPRKPF